MHANNLKAQVIQGCRIYEEKYSDRMKTQDEGRLGGSVV